MDITPKPSPEALEFVTQARTKLLERIIAGSKGTVQILTLREDGKYVGYAITEIVEGEDPHLLVNEIWLEPHLRGQMDLHRFFYKNVREYAMKFGAGKIIFQRPAY